MSTSNRRKVGTRAACTRELRSAALAWSHVWVREGVDVLRVSFGGAAVRVELPRRLTPSAKCGGAFAPAEVTGVDGHPGGGDPAAGAVVVCGGPDGWRIVRDGDHAWSGAADPEALLRRLVSEVHLSLAAASPSDVFVHAGSVAWRGRGIVVPGRSMTGKTTLVRALVEAGAAYLSDEYAVLDGRGRARPFPRALSVRTGDGVVPLDPAGLGSVAAGPVPVAAVVDTRYEAGAAWSPEESRGASVVLPLVGNAVAARLAPERVLEHTAAVAALGAVRWSGPRGDAEATARAILAAVDAMEAGAPAVEVT